ncbi:methyl-accepting chemotaxis protein [Paraburkholderia bryophila]|uniref:methyl-accepting chemotaxis protein n=1 Tax=Paraburkholderia bryophila TaxID=420952 RepID=UPI00234BDC87|nr:methyl-accepting chemotaxis protein [Paraburkholderia bryophila]WCM17940.1 methyl-accepting chemotaxis protein [Paraburkholderia bryophila]
MHENLPVTDEEYVLSELDVIITRTDLTGNIVYANEAFLRSSGYPHVEVIGKPQNIVRHPDMPEEAYRDLWETIGGDRPWTGVVKNRRKQGGYYWVLANVTPVFEKGEKVGYMSVRTKPSSEQIARAARLYERLRSPAGHTLRLSGGTVIRTGVAGVVDRLLRLPVNLRVWATMAMLIAVILLQTLVASGWVLPQMPPLWQARVLAGVGTGLALACGVYLTRNLLMPLQALNAGALSVLNGHIQQRFPERGDAQTRMLGRMLNQMNAKLVGVLIDAKISIDAIRDKTHEFARGNSDLATRTDEQASAIDQTTASLAEITETAEQNALGAERANTSGRQTAETAEVAAGEVQKTVAVMERVREHSRKISDITSVIDAIAFQTNIIALNASVEAARAGQYGRGFAVVASEVRSLAQRAAGAAKEIKSLIETSLHTVTTASQTAARAGETMNTVEQTVTQLTRTLYDIALASRGQSVQIAQINEAVGQVAGLTQRNAALVEQSAVASTDLQQQTQSLESAMSIFHLRSEMRGDVGSEETAEVV